MPTKELNSIKNIDEINSNSKNIVVIAIYRDKSILTCLRCHRAQTFNK